MCLNMFYNNIVKRKCQEIFDDFLKNFFYIFAVFDYIFVVGSFCLAFCAYILYNVYTISNEVLYERA